MSHETELDALRAENKRLRAALEGSIQLLAGWCIAVDRDSTWDGWDEFYKDAAYRPGPLRKMIDAAIAAARKGEQDA